MPNEDVREAVDRVERAMAEVLRTVNEIRIGQASAAGDLRVVTDRLSQAVDRLAHVAERSATATAWWSSKAAVIGAAGLALLVVGRELVPALLELLRGVSP